MMVTKNDLSKETQEFDKLIKVANELVLPNLRKILIIPLIFPVTIAQIIYAIASFWQLGIIKYLKRYFKNFKQRKNI